MVRGTPATSPHVLRQLAAATNNPLSRTAAMPCAALPATLVAASASAHGRCVYVPEMICPAHDLQALEQLSRDIAACSDVLVPHRTKKRLQLFAEALKSSVLPSLVSTVLSSLELVLIDCWVNVYRDGEETTGWHQDHYNLRTPNATATLNINLGATREVALQSVSTGETWTIAQQNGSLFAFDAGFNAAFKHSIPRAKLPPEPESLRLSITIFAADGAEHPSRVMRDAENVPVGVPLEVCWDSWQQYSWVRAEELKVGVGAGQLLVSAPLMRGHQKGKGSNRAQTGKAKGLNGKPQKGSNAMGGAGREQMDRQHLGNNQDQKRRRRRNCGGGRVQGEWAPPPPKPAIDK